MVAQKFLEDGWGDLVAWIDMGRSEIRDISKRSGRRGREAGHLIFAPTFFLALGLFIALVSWKAPTALAEGAPVLVSAAISLQEALSEIGIFFEREHPGRRVRFNFASSGALRRQVEGGAPVDVFAPAGQEPMDALEERGLILKSSRRNFARNAIVLIEPGGRAALKGFDDLASPRVQRLAISDPSHSPAGQYAREVLLSLGLWSTLRPKIVFGGHVRQTLDYVLREEVEAGIVYATDARMARGRVRVVAEAPAGTHRPIIYPAAVVKASSEKKLAQAFILFLLSEKSQSLLGRFGFLPIGSQG